MNVYGKAMMDSKLEAHTKLLEYAKVGFCGVAGHRSTGLVVDSIGRGGGIRTPDPLLPKQMRYQTALRPDSTYCTVRVVRSRRTLTRA
jgi:hypothetical protein